MSDYIHRQNASGVFCNMLRCQVFDFLFEETDLGQVVVGYVWKPSTSENAASSFAGTLQAHG